MRMRLSGVAIALLLSACATAPRPEAAAIADARGANALASSWARNYRTLADLTRAADLIVVGEIGGYVGTVTEGAPIATEFALDIHHVIKDHKRRGGLRTLSLRQAGGATLDRRIAAIDDPLFQKNQRVILFLREFDTGKVVVIGGPNGRFHVENERVVPADKYKIPLDPTLTEAEFVAQIARIVMQQEKGEAGL